MLVWVIYAQTNVTTRLQVVFTATSLCTSRHCFWWLHLRDLPKCVSVFPKVVFRVSAQGLFTSKCCDSHKKHKSQWFLFLFSSSFFILQGTWHLAFCFFPCSVSLKWAVSKQSLVPINLWFPLRDSQTSRVLKFLKRSSVRTRSRCAHTHTQICTRMSWRTIWKYSSFLHSLA